MKNFLSISQNLEIEEICIGKFDGMHLAHQKLFQALSPSKSLILCIASSGFEAMLTPHKQNYTQLPIYTLNLKEVKQMQCEEFVEFLKKRLPNLKKIVVGYDFCFGKNRAHTPKDLESFFEVCVIPEVKIQGISVHKKEIIDCLNQGEIELANTLLGRPYSIEGQVIAGQGRGKKEFFPTLNLEVKNYILPQSGVYACLCQIHQVRYQGACFIGERLSTDGCFAIEVHLLHTHLSTPPQTLQITFLKKIRDNQKFSDSKALKNQIAQDLRQIQDLNLKHRIKVLKEKK